MTGSAEYWAALDADVRTAVEKIPGRDALTVERLPEERQRRSACFPLPSPSIRHSDHRAPHSGSSVGARLRLHRPTDEGVPRPAIFWIHGGGFILGSDLSDEDRLDGWVVAHDCVVVSVDYRLAPEHPYPAGLDDCAAALAWVFENAADVGVDPSRVVLTGISAGGGLAAGITLRARDRAARLPAALVLIYPMLDDRLLDRASRTIESNVWGPKLNALGWSCYLGSGVGRRDISPYAAPARATDLSGLPPTFIGIAEQDVLRDEDLAFAAGLVRDGTRVDAHLYAGTPHGFERSAPAAKVSRRFVRDLDEFLAAQLGH